MEDKSVLSTIKEITEILSKKDFSIKQDEIILDMVKQLLQIYLIDY